MAESLALAVSSIVHPALAVPATFLAVWYGYSKLMFYGIFEGNRGRLAAFAISLIPAVPWSLSSHGVLFGALLAFIYWVRLWRLP
ncbi:MAG: hypothetical protein GXO07_05265 [Crenarchaeota archaeon]|nr:hypothetical protein [Thermoproteota archaeon]